jgi:hypothetical protein
MAVFDPTADPFTFRMLRHFNIPLGEVREWHRICGKEWAQRKPQAIRNTNPESRRENGKQAGDARYFIWPGVSPLRPRCITCGFEKWGPETRWSPSTSPRRRKKLVTKKVVITKNAIMAGIAVTTRNATVMITAAKS